MTFLTADADEIVQLMELAGLSCAQGLAKSFPLKTHRRVMVCCGPGNQVAALIIQIIETVLIGPREETALLLPDTSTCSATSPPSTSPKPAQRTSTSVSSNKSRISTSPSSSPQRISNRVSKSRT